MGLFYVSSVEFLFSDHIGLGVKIAHFVLIGFIHYLPTHDHA